MRRLLALVAIAPALAAIPSGPAEAAPTCLGHRATIVGTDGNDLVDATNTVAGEPLPTDGGDLVYGEGGNDNLSALEGADSLFGGDGNDQLFGDDGDDQINGDAGTDQVEGGAGDDLIYGAQGSDSLDGDDGDDTISGGDGRDAIDGGSGNDVLQGDKGADTIKGGSGDDILIGGVGADVMIRQHETVGRYERTRSAAVEPHARQPQMVEPLVGRIESEPFFENLSRRRVEQPHPLTGAAC